MTEFKELQAIAPQQQVLDKMLKPERHLVFKKRQEAGWGKTKIMDTGVKMNSDKSQSKFQMKCVKIVSPRAYAYINRATHTNPIQWQW
jgi:hypothetical protein